MDSGESELKKFSLEGPPYEKKKKNSRGPRVKKTEKIFIKIWVLKKKNSMGSWSI